MWDPSKGGQKIWGFAVTTMEWIYEFEGTVVVFLEIEKQNKISANGLLISC